MFRLSITDNCDLRLLEPPHAKALFQCVDANREYLRRWFTWVDATKTVEHIKTFIKSSLEHFARDNGFQAGIFVQNKPIGVIGFHALDWVNRKTSMGYWLAESHQHRGLMTLSCRAMLDHAFGTWDLNRVEIRCAVVNARSRAIPQRLGFTEEGVMRQVECVYGQFYDDVVYSMLASEWRAHSATSANQ